MCSMAAFKEHCAFGFWKASLVLDDKNAKAQEAAGHFGRITSVADLPPYLMAALKKNKKALAASRNWKYERE